MHTPAAAALQPELICSMQLTEAQARSFQHAVENNYYFELVFDNLPILAFVGEMREGANGLRPFLYTHKRFDISYNANQVSRVGTHEGLSTQVNHCLGFYCLVAARNSCELNHRTADRDPAGAALATVTELDVLHALPILPSAGAELVFTYEVHWHPTNTPFSERFNRYLDSSFFEHKASLMLMSDCQ
eukprot:scaffold119283_cov19-Tisochrysis_lutea.AAC.2